MNYNKLSKEVGTNHSKPCPKCGAAMRMMEDGMSLTTPDLSGSIRNLWRWTCPECHYCSKGWDGERIVTTRLSVTTVYREYEHSQEPGDGKTRL